MARPATGNVVTRKLANGHTRYSLRFRHNGDRAYETLGTDAEGWDRKRAQDALDDRLAEVRLGTYIAPQRGGELSHAGTVPTFHQFASQWFAQIEPELRESTVDAIRWRLSYVLLPFFQHHQLSDITIAEVDRYRAAKVHERDQLQAARDRGEKIDRRPLSNGTINRTIGLLAQILDVAVEYGHIGANPAGASAGSSRRPGPSAPISTRPLRSRRCSTPRRSSTVDRGPTGSTSTAGRRTPTCSAPPRGSGRTRATCGHGFWARPSSARTSG